MNTRILFPVVIVLLVQPVHGLAQSQQAPPQGAPQSITTAAAPSTEHVRNQVKVFESSLRAALERAATTFGSRVREAILPTYHTEFMFAEEPRVTGVVIPDVGMVFHVQIPALSALDLQMWNAAARRTVARPEVPVSSIDNRTPAPPPPMPFEPNREYTDLTREALYDAVLDNALALPVPEGQTMTVFAGELLPSGTNPLAQRSRLLILTIKAEDLLALRKTEINRDEARARIKESRFGG